MTAVPEDRASRRARTTPPGGIARHAATATEPLPMRSAAQTAAGSPPRTPPGQPPRSAVPPPHVPATTLPASALRPSVRWPASEAPQTATGGLARHRAGPDVAATVVMPATPPAATQQASAAVRATDRDGDDDASSVTAVILPAPLGARGGPGNRAEAVALTMVRPLGPEARTDPEAVLPPGTVVVDVDGRPEDAAPAVAGGADAPQDDAEDVDAEDASTPVLSRREVRARRSSRRRPIGGPIAVAAAVTTLGSQPAPEPRPVAPVAAPAVVPTPPPVPPGPTPGGGPAAATDGQLRAAADPTSREGTAFLEALRGAGIPTSRSGTAETEAAVVICQQIENGAEDQALLKVLPAVLTSVTADQAPLVVAAAREYYC
jgi:hypothetical protein